MYFSDTMYNLDADHLVYSPTNRFFGKINYYHELIQGGFGIVQETKAYCMMLLLKEKLTKANDEKRQIHVSMKLSLNHGEPMTDNEQIFEALSVESVHEHISVDIFYEGFPCDLFLQEGNEVTPLKIQGDFDEYTNEMYNYLRPYPDDESTNPTPRVEHYAWMQGRTTDGKVDVISIVNDVERNPWCCTDSDFLQKHRDDIMGVTMEAGMTLYAPFDFTQYPEAVRQLKDIGRKYLTNDSYDYDYSEEFWEEYEESPEDKVFGIFTSACWNDTYGRLQEYLDEINAVIAPLEDAFDSYDFFEDGTSADDIICGSWDPLLAARITYKDKKFQIVGSEI